MVLTEPDAGSDVGAGRTKARHIEGDVWEIEGVKRFITNGDFDAAENIVHLVLARPEGAGPGTKGLSMFIVPKFWVNEDGSLGERNGVVCTNIEKKMGIKASATCEMTFGEKHPARGLLVGDVHDGIRQMFHVIEHARMGVGVKSMATLSAAYLNALEYAKDRVQGADLLRASDKTAPRVAIIQHPDVRRMLMLQKCIARACARCASFTASIQDQVELSGGHGAAAPTSSIAQRPAAAAGEGLLLREGLRAARGVAAVLRRLGLLPGLPDRAVHPRPEDRHALRGHHGTSRRSTCSSARSPATAARRCGGLLGARPVQTCKEVSEVPELTRWAIERGRWSAPWPTCRACSQAAMLGKLGESPYHVGLHGNRVMLAATAEVVIGWLLVRHGHRRRSRPWPDAPTRARTRLTTDGKLASLRFYGQQRAAGITLTRKIVEKSTLELMSVDVASF
jgi:alkylation response protein AidB-like acyl-CoA dehydrogenase